MRVFLKYIGKSILEKKGRLFLLISSIAISIALLIGTLSASDTLTNMLYEQMKGVYGDYNIQINTNSEAEDFLFSQDCLKDIEYDKQFRSLIINSEYDDAYTVTYVGTSMEDFYQLDNIKILEKNKIETMNDNGIIISNKTSKNFNLFLGDKIEIDILNTKKEFVIVGITSDTGFFLYDTEKAFTVFGSEKEVLDTYGIMGKSYSNIFLSVVSDDIDTWIHDFNEKNLNDNIVASVILDENSINGQLEWLQLTLYFMLAIILVMTIFIISSTFKLIIAERLSIIGTFMSQGSTRGRISCLLLLESCCYGLFGGLLGCVGGVIATKFITDFANPLAEYGISTKLTINIQYFVISFVFAIILSLISAYLPVKGIKKLQVKDVILNSAIVKKESSRKRLIFGLVCLFLTLILFFIDKHIDYVGALPSLLLFLIGLILFIPFLVECTLGGLNNLLRKSNILTMLAFNNVKTSMLLKSTILLITICIMAIIMMLSLSNSIISAINTAYSQMHYDVVVNMQSKNYKEVEDVLDDFVESEDISKIISVATIHTTLNKETTKQIDVYCVDPIAYLDFEDYMYYNNKVAQMKELEEKEDGIIISKLVAKNYGIKEGDKILLATESKEVHMKVLSIVDARMFANGNYNIITQKAAKKLFGVSYSSDYYLVQNKEDFDFTSRLEEDLKGLGARILTKNELIESQEEEISRLVDILNFITFLTVLIGTISCMSNILINFAQRRKEIAVLNSIGLTNRRCMLMLLVESVAQAVLACFIAFVASLVINELFVGVYEFLDMDLTFRFPSAYAGIIFGITLTLVLILNLFTILKSRKIKIIEEIKYE